ncbi:sulfotransferase family protein [Actinosynnema sp. NPDC023587]|uniref:sulfotransferase family protein n=1 Tax=Actinosynnema sp. NPDC023587 TaxID=3154695 RepID=UPI0033FFE87A
MKVIGVGFGRTGTLSVKAALEELGFGPCYHMVTAVERPEHLRLWNAAHRGDRVDWDQVFAGFESTVDWPACDFRPELVERYPDAKVVLTVRDPERWYDSFADTLVPLWTEDSAVAATAPERYREYFRLVRGIATRTFGGRLEDKAHVVEVYRRHNDEVRAAVPADRLLVHEVKDGWEPLCRFLGVPVPTGREFPHLNDRASYHAMVERLLTG